MNHMLLGKFVESFCNTSLVLEAVLSVMVEFKKGILRKYWYIFSTPL